MNRYLIPPIFYIRVNRAYAESCGHHPDFFIGKNHFDLYPSDEVESIFQLVVRTGKPFSIWAKPFVFPDDPERGITYWDWTVSSIKSGNKSVDRLLFCLVDVTEKERSKLEVNKLNHELEQKVVKRTEELKASYLKLQIETLERRQYETALKTSEKKYRTLVENSPDYIVRLDLEGRIRFINSALKRAFADLMKLRTEVFVNRTYREFGFPAEQCDFCELARQKVIESKESLHLEHVFNTKMGMRIFNCRLIPEFDDQSNVETILALCHDITLKKQIEYELR